MTNCVVCLKRKEKKIKRKEQLKKKIKEFKNDEPPPRVLTPEEFKFIYERDGIVLSLNTVNPLSLE